MAREPGNVAASVRARLQNLAREQQANFQRVLTRYSFPSAGLSPAIHARPFDSLEADMDMRPDGYAAQ